AIRELIAKERPDVAHFHNFMPLVSPAAYDASLCGRSRSPDPAQLPSAVPGWDVVRRRADLRGLQTQLDAGRGARMLSGFALANGDGSLNVGRASPSRNMESLGRCLYRLESVFS